MTDIMPRFLYHTIPGRCLLKLLISPGLSRMAGKALSSKVSRRIIPWYIRKYGIEMGDIEIPSGGFSSFNDFFTRKRRESQKHVEREGQIICPCDGLLSVAQIREGSQFQIKGTTYNMQELLEDDELSVMLQGGKALIIRLTPQHYHRYCYSTDGTVLQSRRIEGKLHCVRPIALDTVPVFVQNSREYQLILTRNRKKMVHMEIGALLVGKISNHFTEKNCSDVLAGEEKGFFEFGGSTIVLLFEHEMAQFDCELIDGNSKAGEVPVRMGQILGTVMK